MATRILTTDDMCDFNLVFSAVRSSHLPTVTQLRAVGSLETYRELTLAQFRQRMQQARLEAFCLGRVPTKRGTPKTTIATCDEEIVTL